jgi:hypothetical protein
MAMAAFGAARLLTSFKYGLLLTLSLLSLKRSAVLGIMALSLLAPKRRGIPSRKSFTRGLVAVCFGVVVIVALPHDPILSALEHRALSGMEQIHGMVTDSVAEASSLGARVSENDTALAAWIETPASMLFGAPLERYRLGSREALAVHNTFLSVVHLGGLLYPVVFALTILPVRRHVIGRISRRHHRWYLAAAIAVLIEGLAGNALLTASLGASLAVLCLRRPNICKPSSVPTRRHRTQES